MYESPIEQLRHLNIGEVLQAKLNTLSPGILRKQLADTENIRYEIALKRVQWYEKLSNERERARMPKGTEYTEMDRKTMLEANTSVIESDYRFLLALEEIIKERLELGQTFLQTL